MPVLTQIQLTNLENRLNAGDVQAFYVDLELYGDPYGRLGKAVTSNTGWQGEIANGFAANDAKLKGVNLNYNSTEWKAVNKELAQKYIDFYKLNNGVTPAWDQVQKLHNDVYEAHNLDKDAWLPNRLLDTAGDKAALWQDYLTNTGSGDVWGDAFDILRLSFDYTPIGYGAITLDPANLDFTKNFINAMAGMSTSGLIAMRDDFNPFSAAAGWLSGMAESYRKSLFDLGWAVQDAKANPSQLLPDWAQFCSIYGQVGAQKMSVRAVWSPLVLDLDGDGIETTKLGYGTGASRTYFDMDANGTLERTGWITGGDGLLTLDRNNNGKIDNQSELFGNNAQYADGFANLKSLDSNIDNKITNLDAQFANLRVWIDADGDAITDAGELKTLTSIGITSIDLNATQYRDSWGTYNRYNNENLVTAGSTFTMNGVTRTVEDVWFARDVMNTVQGSSYTLDARTLFLPTLKGFGALQDLHVAMSTDSTLLTMVQASPANDNTRNQPGCLPGPRKLAA